MATREIREKYQPNLSFATTTSFVGKINLSDKDDTVLTTFVQELETPTFTKGYTTRKKGNENVYLKGEMKDKTPIAMNFIIDDDWWVYTALLDLFNDDVKLEDVQLFLLGGNDLAKVAITYQDPMITSIGGLQFNTKDDGALEVFCPVEIIYSKFTYERIK